MEGIYKIVFESILEGLILVDKRGVIQLINPRTEEMFGYSEGELIGKTIEVLIPDQFRHSHVSQRDTYIEKPSKRNMGSGMNLWGKRKDDSVFPVEISLNYIKDARDETMVVALVSDISVRKRAQDEVLKINQHLEELVEQRTHELFESELLYKSIAKNYPSGIIYLLDLEYTIKFVEGRELERHGKKPADCIGKDYLSTCDAPYTEEINSVLNKLIASGIADSIEIFKHGQYYSLTASLLFDSTGNVNRILVVENNITYQRKNAESLEHNLREEKQLSELKSRFVSMASHEFRTPLTTVSSSAGLIKRYAETQDIEKINKHADRIRSTVGHLTNLLNDFLSLEKLESGKQDIHISSFDFLPFITELKEDMTGAIKAGQEIVLEGENTLIQSDVFFLKAVLINLVSNASKYSNEGEQITIRWKTDNDSMTIAVVDHGIGIPKEEQELMFTRFFRAGNVTNIEGTGLGLFIVTKYLDLLNGTIKFESNLGEGSVFTIQIPIH